MLDERLLMPVPLVGGGDRDVVLHSCVRLGRNLEDALFPNRASITEALETRGRLLAAIARVEPARIELLMEDLEAADSLLLAERGWAEPSAASDPGRGLAVVDGGATFLSVNDVDHLRILSQASGNDCALALARARRVDEALDAELGWAATSELGYLSARLEEGGPALQVSALVFIPGIVAAGVLERVVRGLMSSGIEPRVVAGNSDTEAMVARMDPSTGESPATGEAESQRLEALASGSSVAERPAPYVELVCRAKRGIGEEDFLIGFQSALSGLIEGERRTRDRLLASRRAELEDAAWRAAALLACARLLSEEEAHRLIADLRAGVAYGVAPPYSRPQDDPFTELDLARSVLGVGQLRVLERRRDDIPPGIRHPDVARAALVRDVLPRYDIQ